MLEGEAQSLIQQIKCEICQVRRAIVRVGKEQTSISTEELLEEFDGKVAAIAKKSGKGVKGYPVETQRKISSSLNEATDRERRILVEESDARIAKYLWSTVISISSNIDLFFDDLKERLPIEHEKVKKKHASVVQPLLAKINDVPKMFNDVIVQGALDQINSLASSNLETLLLLNEQLGNKARKSKEIMANEGKERVERECDQIFNQYLESHVPFTRTMLNNVLEDKVNELFDGLSKQFPNTDWNDERHNFLANMQQKVHRPYVNCIRKILKQCSLNAHADLQQVIQQKMLNLDFSKLDENQLKVVVKSAVVDVKRQISANLQGWSIPEMDVIDIGDHVVELGAALMESYLVKLESLKSSKTAKRERDLYARFLSKHCADTMEKILSRLPMEERILETLFHQTCHNAARKLVTQYKDNLRVVKSFDEVFDQLSCDSMDVLTSLKKSNEQEKSYSDNHRKEMQEMRRIIAKRDEEHEARRMQLETSLREQENKSNKLVEDLQQVQKQKKQKSRERRSSPNRPPTKVSKVSLNASAEKKGGVSVLEAARQQANKEVQDRIAARVGSGKKKK